MRNPKLQQLLKSGLHIKRYGPNTIYMSTFSVMKLVRSLNSLISVNKDPYNDEFVKLTALQII